MCTCAYVTLLTRKNTQLSKADKNVRGCVFVQKEIKAGTINQTTQT
jgi:hypothetical protein